jgi:hypothetical protein
MAGVPEAQRPRQAAGVVGLKTMPAARQVLRDPWLMRLQMRQPKPDGRRALRPSVEQLLA